MHHLKDGKYIRQSRVDVMMLAAIAASALGASSWSCLLDTRTIHCEGFDLYCKPEQVCAPIEGGGFECVDRGSCGDGRLNEGEECDDSNLIDGDGCDRNCTFTGCGNGIPTGDEECDSRGVDTALCNGGNCRRSRCGDGYPNSAAGEECDDGDAPSRSCNSPYACKLSRCGDSYYNPLFGEECDTGIDTQTCNGDGNGVLSNNLDAECHIARCGDGYTNLAHTPEDGARDPEECDNLNGIDTVRCNGNNGGKDGVGSCRMPRCGDGYKNPEYIPGGGASAPEECDNLGGGDSALCNGNRNGNAGVGSCRTAACGDGYTNSKFSPTPGGPVESCDDAGNSAYCNGNDFDNDGSVDNKIGSCQPARCGDGYTNPRHVPQGAMASEECDNLGGGDSPTCNGNNRGADGPGSCRRPGCRDGYWNKSKKENGEPVEVCDVVGGVSEGCPTGACNITCTACL